MIISEIFNIAQSVELPLTLLTLLQTPDWIQIGIDRAEGIIRESGKSLLTLAALAFIAFVVAVIKLSHGTSEKWKFAVLVSFLVLIVSIFVMLRSPHTDKPESAVPSAEFVGTWIGRSKYGPAGPKNPEQEATVRIDKSANNTMRVYGNDDMQGEIFKAITPNRIRNLHKQPPICEEFELSSGKLLGVRWDDCKGDSDIEKRSDRFIYATSEFERK